MTTIKENLAQFTQEINSQFDHDIIPQLMDYIKIPNKSPAFDPDWEKHGFMDQAMQLIVHWCQKQKINNMSVELHKEPGRTPLLFIEIAAFNCDSDKTILLYGHMDKQPEMKGWDEDKDPWKPVLIENKLYGRGGADDGYAVFASLTAIAQLQKYHIAHDRCVIIIEGSEESASLDLPFYLNQLNNKIGNVDFVICLDSGAANYEQLWVTTSLRGLAAGVLFIEMLSEGIHSGLGSGIVPSCFTVLRQLLDRIENKETGEIIIDELKVNIPHIIIEQAKHTAEQLGDDIVKAYPLIGKAQPINNDPAELLLNRSWRAQLSVTGCDGMPTIANAGNVTLPKIAVKLSMRTPPTSDADKANRVLKKILENNPPFGANIHYHMEPAGNGWQAPLPTDWLVNAANEASQSFFKKPAAYIGEGGTIPFMGMLGNKYPHAPFLITGVLGPRSNAHGPNEFLHIPMVKKITGCVASVIESFHLRGTK